jgi:hypothetical protein
MRARPLAKVFETIDIEANVQTFLGSLNPLTDVTTITP